MISPLKMKFYPNSASKVSLTETTIKLTIKSVLLKPIVITKLILCQK
jgi:hypothetical protein